MNEHLLKRFDDELNKLRYRLIKMSTLVQQQLELSLKAIIEDNEDYTKLVIELEEKVDKLDLKIDKQCLRIFALHQPVATDLRLVLSTVSINDNLEMLGDLATIIAKSFSSIKLIPGIIPKTKLSEIQKQLNIMISKLMDSVVFMKPDYALDSITIYEELNRLSKENYNILIGLMKVDAANIDLCAALIDINRSIQNISRIAKGIAEELVFLVEARMIKHQGYNPSGLKIEHFGEEIDDDADLDSDIENFKN